MTKNIPCEEEAIKQEIKNIFKKGDDYAKEGHLQAEKGNQNPSKNQYELAVSEYRIATQRIYQLQKDNLIGAEQGKTLLIEVFRKDADISIRNKNHKKAIKSLRKMVELDKDNVDALIDTACLDIELDNFQEFKKHHGKLKVLIYQNLDKNIDASRYTKLLYCSARYSNYLYNEDKYEEALYICNTLLIEKYPNIYNIYELIGKIYTKLNKIEDAISAYQKAIDNNSKTSKIYIRNTLNLANAYITNRESDVAHKLISQITDDDYNTLDQSSQILLRNKSYILRIKLGFLNHKHFEVQEKLSKLHINSHNLYKEDVIELNIFFIHNICALIRHITRKQEESDVLKITHDCKSNTNIYNSIIEFSEKILELDSKNTFAYTSKIMALNSMNKTIEALEAMDKLLKIDPENFYAYMTKIQMLLSNNAEVLNDIRKYDDAKKLHNKYKGSKIDIRDIESILLGLKTMNLDCSKKLLFLRYKGEYEVLQNKHDIAAPCFYEAIQIWKNNLSYFQSKTQSQWVCQIDLKTFDIFNIHLEITKVIHESYYFYCNSLIKTKQYNQADKVLDEVYNLTNIRDGYWYYKEAQCKYGLKLYETLIQSCNNAYQCYKKKSPDKISDVHRLFYSQILYLKSKAQIKLSKYDDAIDTLNHASIITPFWVKPDEQKIKLYINLQNKYPGFIQNILQANILCNQLIQRIHEPNKEDFHMHDIIPIYKLKLYISVRMSSKEENNIKDINEYIPTKYTDKLSNAEYKEIINELNSYFSSLKKSYNCDEYDSNTRNQELDKVLMGACVDSSDNDQDDSPQNEI